MDKDTLRKVQLIQLEIAKEVKRVCEKNDIAYWLDSGTLLGAIRHKGFIPWDDDLDIGMWRDDYNRFVQLAVSELSPEFYLQTWETDENYGLVFAKVRKRGTVYIENKAQKSTAGNGIYVDIFPYDNYGNDKWGQGVPIKIIKLLMVNKAKIQAWREGDGIRVSKLIQHLPFLIASHFVSRRWLMRHYNTLATKYNDQPCEYCFPQGISNYGKWIIPRRALEETTATLFEDDYFAIPKGFDAYLTNAYGSYMELPPEDQRENRHQILEVHF